MLLLTMEAARESLEELSSTFLMTSAWSNLVILKTVCLSSLLGVAVLAIEAALFYRGDFARRAAADGLSFREASGHLEEDTVRSSLVTDAPTPTYLPFFFFSSSCRYMYLASRGLPSLPAPSEAPGVAPAHCG